MQDMVLFATNVGDTRNMPQNGEKKSEQILVNLDPVTYARVVEIASREDRPKGYIARELMLRGLSAYEQDGRLRGEAPQQTEAIKQLAPVLALIEGGQMTRRDVQRMIEAADIDEIEKRLKPRRTQKIPVGAKAR